ncbi:hypothetical protein PR048_000070 [Dryococelus australis]|uniref:Uncharacterized protein n=1 Tax=Dryococelus australis TaxID=614101 RepID=A0ABQ9IDL3_9NEOP|nr:hypothetical protein PR048_000070 [Dryococelus australis]
MEAAAPGIRTHVSFRWHMRVGGRLWRLTSAGSRRMEVPLFPQLARRSVPFSPFPLRLRTGDVDITARLPSRRTGFDSRRGHPRIFTCGNGFLADLPFPAPLHSGAATYSPRFTSIVHEAKKLGSNKGDIATHFKCAIGTRGEALDGRAVFSLHCVNLQRQFPQSALALPKSWQAGIPSIGQGIRPCCVMRRRYEGNVEWRKASFLHMTSAEMDVSRSLLCRSQAEEQFGSRISAGLGVSVCADIFLPDWPIIITQLQYCTSVIRSQAPKKHCTKTIPSRNRHLSASRFTNPGSILIDKPFVNKHLLGFTVENVYTRYQQVLCECVNGRGQHIYSYQQVLCECVNGRGQHIYSYQQVLCECVNGRGQHIYSYQQVLCECVNGRGQHIYSYQQVLCDCVNGRGQHIYSYKQVLCECVNGRRQHVLTRTHERAKHSIKPYFCLPGGGTQDARENPSTSSKVQHNSHLLVPQFPYSQAVHVDYWTNFPPLDKRLQFAVEITDVSMEQRRNARAGETGDPRENPLTSDIVWYDSKMRNPGSDPAGNRTRFV